MGEDLVESIEEILESRMPGIDDHHVVAVDDGEGRILPSRACCSDVRFRLVHGDDVVQIAVQDPHR